MLYSTNYPSPFGEVSLASDGKNVVGLWPVGHKYFEATVEGNVERKSELPVLVMAKKWLDAYFSGRKPPISELPLAPIGGEFRKVVWDILCEIPYGRWATYGEVAKKVASRMNKENMSSRAVGGAVGHNPISIIIPCHRVVGSNGSLTGYGGGIGYKVKLLELEGVDMSNFFVPIKGTAL